MSWGNRFDRKNKYGGSQRKKHEHKGLKFDSKLEAALFDLLSLRESAGEIHSLTHQPGTVFLSKARIQFRPDFRFVNCKTGKTEYAESKGFPNDRWPTKKKLWKHYGPGPLYIYRGTAARLRLDETVTPLEAA